MTRNVLVIRGGAIGDFVLTLPVLTALRNRFPKGRLEVLGYPRIASLASAAGIVDAVRSLEAPELAGFFSPHSDLDLHWASYFSGFDTIISYVYDPEHIFQRNVNRCSKAQFVVSHHRPDESQEVHAATFFLRALAALGIADTDSTPRLSFNELGPVTGEIWLAAHPGSGSARKNWPETNWLGFLEQLLVRKNWRCLLVGGEAEGDRLQRFRRRYPSNRLEIAQDLPLVELARRLCACDAFLGHDSGISHLAAAAGVRSLVLWGHTKEAIWRPLGPRVRILKGRQGLENLNPEVVLDEVERLFSSV
jgi:heptosyltransferase-3